MLIHAFASSNAACTASGEGPPTVERMSTQVCSDIASYTSASNSGEYSFS